MSKKEMLEKYGDVDMIFYGYCKYTFTYIGFTDKGLKVVARAGGTPSSIYEDEVMAGISDKLRDLLAYEVYVWKGDTLVEEFNE